MARDNDSAKRNETLQLTMCILFRIVIACVRISTRCIMKYPIEHYLGRIIELSAAAGSEKGIGCREWEALRKPDELSVRGLAHNGYSWRTLLEMCGLRSRRGRKISKKLPTEYYKGRIKELSALHQKNKCGITAKWWDKNRLPHEEAARTIAQKAGQTWSQILEELGLSVYRGKEVKMDKIEAEEAALFASMELNARPDEAQPLRLIASDKPRGRRRVYCWNRRGYVEEVVLGGGRFENY